MSEADLAEVEEANLRFYRAFETLDLAQMDAVWLLVGGDLRQHHRDALHDQ
jgi:hypothetical protein